MDDVERPVRPGQGAPVAQDELEAVRGADPVVDVPGRSEDLLAAVERCDPERPAGRGGPRDQRHRDVGRPRPDVEQRVRPGPPGQQLVDGAPGRPGAPEPPVDPREVAQVPPERRGVVQGAVEELVGAGEASHTPGAYPTPGPRPDAGRARAGPAMPQRARAAAIIDG